MSSRDMMLELFHQRSVIPTHCGNPHRKFDAHCCACLTQFNRELCRALEAEKSRTTPPTSRLLAERDAEISEACRQFIAAGIPTGHGETALDLASEAVQLVTELKAELEAEREQPIPMILHCPKCGKQHVDSELGS